MEVDTEEQQQGAEVQPAQPAVTNLQLAILATVKTAQLQNGLKHGDYSRYRCDVAFKGSELVCCHVPSQLQRIMQSAVAAAVEHGYLYVPGFGLHAAIEGASHHDLTKLSMMITYGIVAAATKAAYCTTHHTAVWSSHGEVATRDACVGFRSVAQAWQLVEVQSLLRKSCRCCCCCHGSMSCVGHWGWTTALDQRCHDVRCFSRVW